VYTGACACFKFQIGDSLVLVDFRHAQIYGYATSTIYALILDLIGTLHIVLFYQMLPIHWLVDDDVILIILCH
jgi:hypothetical protein